MSLFERAESFPRYEDDAESLRNALERIEMIQAETGCDRGEALQLALLLALEQVDQRLTDIGHDQDDKLFDIGCLLEANLSN